MTRPSPARTSSRAGRSPGPGARHDPGTKVVHVYVGYLRSELGRDRISMVRGMAYVLRP